jgi:hypothetical protein
MMFRPIRNVPTLRRLFRSATAPQKLGETAASGL